MLKKEIKKGRLFKGNRFYNLLPKDILRIVNTPRYINVNYFFVSIVEDKVRVSEVESIMKYYEWPGYKQVVLFNEL